MEQKVLNELVNGLKMIFTSELNQIILYGSVARGTQTEQSDIDIAVVLYHQETEEAKEKLLDFLVDLDLKYDRVFSIVDIELPEFEEWGHVLPFFRNVKEEGIVLWKAA